MRHISSRENPRFKALRRLAESGRERRKAGLTLLDGVHLAAAWVAAGRPVVDYYLREGLAPDSEIMRFIGAHAPTTATLLPPSLFDEVAAVDTPSGLLAVVEIPPGKGAPSPSVDTVILDGVQDPGNLGSILRSAAAAGFHQVVLSPDCANPWHPKTLRGGMGAQCCLEIFDHCDVSRFLETFEGHAAATVLSASSDLFAVAIPKPVAWIFGSEGAGVRPEIEGLATLRVRIPMAAGVESLNVAAAAAVCLFETRRQRAAVGVSKFQAANPDTKSINA